MTPEQIDQPSSEEVRPGPRARIELRDASVRIDGRAVLSDLTLSLDVRRLAVVGRNGSGKSTLARLVAGLIPPSSGRVRVNGADLATDRKRALDEVGILFQNPDHQIIFPTVTEEIAFGLTQKGQDRAGAEGTAREVLDRFGKAHWDGAPVTALSQGQKHLLCLMAVVAMAPRLLILDEPFAGLDLPTRAQLQRYLGLYRGSVVHITHDPTDVAGWDRALWLDRGRIRAEGPGDQVIGAYLDEMKSAGESDDIADISG